MWWPRGLLLWRHLSTVLAGLALLYSGYVLVQMLLLEATVPSPHQPLSLLANTEQEAALIARNTHIQNLLQQSSHHGEPLRCPLNVPVLQVLDHSTTLYQYIPCAKLFYNRVPKCGSRSLISVFKNEFVNDFSSLEGPMLYTRHLHYVNFTKFGLSPPLYINVIRDPVERLISHYYYKQYGSQSKPLLNQSSNMSLDKCVRLHKDSCLHLNTIIIPFFCGHDRRCRLNTVLAVQKAKRSVRESYQVVGITEDLPGFIEVLEDLFPQFFFNATSVYKEHERDLHKLYQTVKKPEVSEDTIAALRDHLALQYDFYRFVKQRFYVILTKIRFMKRNAMLGDQRTKRRQSKFDALWERI